MINIRFSGSSLSALHTMFLGSKKSGFQNIVDRSKIALALSRVPCFLIHLPSFPLYLCRISSGVAMAKFEQGMELGGLQGDASDAGKIVETGRNSMWWVSCGHAFVRCSNRFCDAISLKAVDSLVVVRISVLILKPRIVIPFKAAFFLLSAESFAFW